MLLCDATPPWGPKSTLAALLCIQKMLYIMQPNAFWAPSGSLMRSKGPSQALPRPNSTEDTKSSVLHKEYLHLTVTKPSMLHLISPPCGPTIHREPHSKLPVRLRVSIGALVKTIAGAVPEAQFQPVAHSMRPILSNISRFQSIAVVQPRAKGAVFCSPSGPRRLLAADIVIRSPWATLYYGWRVGVVYASCHCKRIRDNRCRGNRLVTLP